MEQTIRMTRVEIPRAPHNAYPSHKVIADQ